MTQNNQERVKEFRVLSRQLDEVCLDCTDFLNHPCVECTDCPVKRLKDRFIKGGR